MTGGQGLRGALLILATTVLITGVGVAADLPGDLQIWQSFREALRSGRMADPERYRPLQPDLRQPIMGFLEEIRTLVRWEDPGPKPEVFHVGNRVHYLIPLVLQRGDSTFTKTFCFTLVLEGDQWYFQHLEGIFIRLDQVGEPPVSRFPDVPDGQKAWMRDEVQTTKDVRLFDYLRREKGEEFALDWFKDGRGYALGAQTWVPFVSPERAFILYLCWDLSKLRGEPVVLEELNDDSARVRFAPRALALYEQTGHLKQQIGIEDLRRLFETVWTDRARNAGWDLGISYDRGECVFRFVKNDSSSRAGAKQPGDRR